MTANVTGETESGPLRLHFDRSVKLAFHGSAISSDGGLLLHRELDDALGLTDMAAGLFADPRTGRNGHHRLISLLRQSVFSRLAGYEDVNDADRLSRDPVMRQLIGGRAVKHGAASASAMRFTTFASSPCRQLPLSSCAQNRAGLMSTADHLRQCETCSNGPSTLIAIDPTFAAGPAAPAG